MTDAAAVVPSRVGSGNSAGGSIRATDRPSSDRARNFQNSVPANDQVGSIASPAVSLPTLPRGAGLLSTSALLVLAETRTQESIANQTFPAPANLGRAINSYNSAGGQSRRVAVVAEQTTNIEGSA